MNPNPNDYFEILAPRQWLSPAVFNSPHSGRFVPDDLLAISKLSAAMLRKSEDCFIDELFSGCLDAGAPMLRALVARAYVDLNREPYEFDPKIFAETIPGYMNSNSPRVAGGLGTIPRLVAEGEEIYRVKLPLAAGLLRIQQVYLPYHRTLSALMNEVHGALGHAVLVDCHSMPSSAVNETGRTIDVVLGDRFGSSCDPDISNLLESLLMSAGFRVVRNRPYAGGFITQSHGAPSTGRHALQIEINRKLYMDEVHLEKTKYFAAMKNEMNKIIQTMMAYLIDRNPSCALAAE